MLIGVIMIKHSIFRKKNTPIVFSEKKKNTPIYVHIENYFYFLVFFSIIITYIQLDMRNYNNLICTIITT